jgi:large subunit ribosomal protein L29
MKPAKLRDMSREDLLQEENDLREQLFRLRFQSATGQLESAPRMRIVRRDIARIKTILREMELAQAATNKREAGK